MRIGNDKDLRRRKGQTHHLQRQKSVYFCLGWKGIVQFVMSAVDCMKVFVSNIFAGKSHKAIFLTAIIDPRVVNLLDVVPVVRPPFTRDYHRRLSIIVVLKLGFEMKSNHCGLSVIVQCSIDA